MSDRDAASTDTSPIREWRSIVTLLTFVFTNIVVLFPFYVPVFLPRCLTNAILDALATVRVIPPRQPRGFDSVGGEGSAEQWVRFNFPLNFVTMPLIATLFLLAILAIGRDEVYDGTIGTNSIFPIDIMAFFLTLAYIAISIDASGLIRFLAFKVLQKGGKVGHQLFFYLYAFFFGLGTFIGNDPIILSGTAFLAYMTRVSNNIEHPRAWIHTQFAIANIASAILVSSNPTNLVLAGAFNIKFIDYTANMIVPVLFTAIVLFPFLLYIVFADESLIPLSITMHELSAEAQAKKPVNPNIPHARGNAAEEENLANSEKGKLLSLEEIMNPFLDKSGAVFGAVIMAATLITVLALNASTQSGKQATPVFYVTVPAAFVMFCWDFTFGWIHRQDTREVAKKGRAEVEQARIQRALQAEHDARHADVESSESSKSDHRMSGAAGDHISPIELKNEVQHGANLKPIPASPRAAGIGDDRALVSNLPLELPESSPTRDQLCKSRQSTVAMSTLDEKEKLRHDARIAEGAFGILSNRKTDNQRKIAEQEIGFKQPSGELCVAVRGQRSTLVTLIVDGYRWSQETFPTVTVVLSHLPFALVPFAFCMFILVQGLVTKGWVPVFAYGWDHWVNKTGTVGSVGGMGFLSVILCNFAGTNIGTTILLSRVIQAWVAIHEGNGTPISDRSFWAAVYGMALGVNYGAFSIAFSASLAGLLWRDILARKHIRVRSFEFARVNIPIIAISMTVGCAILIAEVYIMRSDNPTDFMKLRQ